MPVHKKGVKDDIFSVLKKELNPKTFHVIHQSRFNFSIIIKYTVFLYFVTVTLSKIIKIAD